MTNETKNRINAYIQELPYMKEKVFGALLMFVVAAVVVVSATYAWVTLSRSPEVSEIKTTMAANGALEIALAKPDDSEPDEWEIDESQPTGDANVTISNLEWGNLVNLSDPSYGMDNIALRPAELNLSNLLGQPLSGVVYGEDGRGVEKDSTYAFAKYNVSEKNFVTAKNKEDPIYGVRAIVSYEPQVSTEAQAEYTAKMKEAFNAIDAVSKTYVGAGSKFSALGKMVSVFAGDTLNKTYTPLGQYVDDMIPVYEAVLAAMEKQKDAFVALANLQYYPSATADGAPFVPLTWENLYTNRAQYNTEEPDVKSTNGIISLPKLDDFIEDYEQIQQDLSHLRQYNEGYANGKQYYWYGYYKDADGNTVYDDSVSNFTLDKIVDRLIVYRDLEVDLEGDNSPPGTRVTDLADAGIGTLAGALYQYRQVYITDGIMYRFEQYFIGSDYRISTDKNSLNYATCTIEVSYSGIGGKVYGEARTMAEGASWSERVCNNSLDGELSPNIGAAQDTFGLAVDLWVRTNAEETNLILERPIAFDENGNKYIYGANRVWGPTDEYARSNQAHRTTQGGGSCYTYYADTPEDMARSLELLKSMKVAFVDRETGKKLAQADMDTSGYWAVNGRVTVPLVLDENAETYTYFEDGTGEQVGRRITTMHADVSRKITAIVYLNGTNLTNDAVLATSEIQGSLNIQFASSENLDTVIEEHDKMYTAERIVTAQFVVGEEKTLEEQTMKHSATVAERTVTIELEIDGEQPDSVTAFFVRAINETQGTREDSMQFTRQDDGTWLCQHTFTAPGIYYLRQVRLNNADYTLSTPLKVTVQGIALKSATLIGGSSDTIYTSQDFYQVGVEAVFSSDDTDEQPETVQILFARNDGNFVSVPLAYNSGSGKWTGEANFTASGEYTMDYVLYTLAGDRNSYRDDVPNKVTLDLSLGMKVKVKDSSGLTDIQMTYNKDAPAGIYDKAVEVWIYNNAGEEVKPETEEDQSKLFLYYARGGSTADTRTATLTWNNAEECYTGTLPLDKPGWYTFDRVEMNGQTLREPYETPPKYTIISTDVPEYDDKASATSMRVQPVGYANDAVLDGIVIKNSESACVTLVVYNDKADDYFECTFDGGTNATATILDNSWTAQLPTYRLPTGETDAEGEPIYGASTQDGTWSLAAVYLWNCYDKYGEPRQIVADDEGTEKNEAVYNPILWVAGGELGQGYLNTLSGEKAIKPDDDELDFSALTTTVTSTVKVTVNAGETAFGDKENTPFLTTFKVSDLSVLDGKYFISVAVTDKDGNGLSKNKVRSMVLTIEYDPNVATKDGYAEYGYAVTSNTSAKYTLPMSYNDNAGAYVVDATDAIMKYVGEYKVKSLTVVFNDGTEEGKTETYYYSSNIGLPDMYTVATKGPGTGDISVSVANPETLGKVGTTETGTFLQEYSLGSYFPVTISLQNAANASFVDTSKLLAATNPVQLVLSYRDGTTAPNGGYTWSGTTGYETITPPMTNSGNTYTPNLTTSLLAGTYHVSATVTLADGTTMTAVPVKNSEERIALEVYSKLPDVTMALASGTPEKVDVSMSGGIYTVNPSLVFEGTNAVTNNGHSAVVFMKYTPGASNAGHSDSCGNNDTPPNVDKYANYTKPYLTFTLSDCGTGVTTALSDFGNQDAVSWSGGNSKVTAGIGTITTNAKYNDGGGHTYKGIYNCDYYYTTEKVMVIGERMVTTITSKDSKNIEYERTLATPLSIVQNNFAVPSVTFFGVEEPFVTPEAQYSEDGRHFEYTLPQTLYTSSGDVSDKSSVERLISQQTEGADVTSQLPSIDDLTDSDWVGPEDVTTGTHIGTFYTRSEEQHKANHSGSFRTHWTKKDAYYYTVVQTVYEQYQVKQRVDKEITIDNATVSTITNFDIYEIEQKLDYWLVGDTKCDPGETITVSGNLLVRPVLKSTETKTMSKKLTESVNGKAVFMYYVTCNAAVMTQTATYPQDTKPYCEYSSCATYDAKGSATAADAAAKATAAEIANLDYTYTEKTETIRSNVSTEWQYGGMDVQNGTSSTKTEYFDLKGNLISSE